ncbi:MAG: InlB B-repeat-containing protein, partial [Candidatus Scatosoma sp.]
MRLLKRISVCFMSVFLAAGFVACSSQTKTAQSFTVSFDVCAPDGVKTNVLLDKKAEYGEVIEEPKVAQRSGDNSYFIEGWYEDAAYTKEWDFDIDCVRNDLTLYAKWGRKYTVEYYSNQSPDEAVYSSTVKDGRRVY